MPRVWEVSEQQKRNAAIDGGERIFGVTFEPWEMAWLESSGTKIEAWIAAAIRSRFEDHGQRFPEWTDAPAQCDLCGEVWNYRVGGTHPYVYDITGGVGVKTWAIGKKMYLHAECASEVIATFHPDRESRDQIGHKLEVADRIMAGLAARLGIENE